MILHFNFNSNKGIWKKRWYVPALPSTYSIVRTVELGYFRCTVSYCTRTLYCRTYGWQRWGYFRCITRTILRQPQLSQPQPGHSWCPHFRSKPRGLQLLQPCPHPQPHPRGPQSRSPPRQRARQLNSQPATDRVRQITVLKVLKGKLFVRHVLDNLRPKNE